MRTQARRLRDLHQAHVLPHVQSWREIAQGLECQHCKAKPGEPCKTESGRPTTPHTARLKATIPGRLLSDAVLVILRTEGPLMQYDIRPATGMTDTEIHLLMGHLAEAGKVRRVYPKIHRWEVIDDTPDRALEREVRLSSSDPTALAVDLLTLSEWSQGWTGDNSPKLRTDHGRRVWATIQEYRRQVWRKAGDDNGR